MKSKKQQNVFIVDDNDIDRSMLLNHLEKYPNLKTQGFSNGEYCIRGLLLEQLEEPDIVLMDYFLDFSTAVSKDGIEILKKLKEICPKVSVIMMTRVKNEKIIEYARKQGALDYVVKGFDALKELDTVLHKHFGFKKNIQPVQH